MSLTWKYYRVILQLRDRICGGVPKNPAQIDGWIRSKMTGEGLVEQLIADTTAAVEGQLTEEQKQDLASAAWIGFLSSPEGLYLEGRQAKALIKEAANILRGTLDVTALRARVAERVFVMEDRILLGVQEPTGFYERCVHAMTASGPVNALKRVDYVVRPRLVFHLKCLPAPIQAKIAEAAPVEETEKPRRGRPAKAQTRAVGPEEYIPLLLEYGGENGIGADRSQGSGRFDLVEFTALTVAPELGPNLNDVAAAA